MSIDQFKGRGSTLNPANRFETTELEIDLSEFEFLDPEDRPKPQTKFYKDSSKTIVNKNDSPDVGFTFSVNPYRGCEHGCSYCFARPTHEYLAMSAGLDFETKIFVKEDAPILLRDHLMKKSWRPEVIVMSGVTDCYQPIERKLKITRKCLEVLCEFKNPVAIITKNALVTRDIDIYQEMAKYHCAHINISVTSLDNELCGNLEPRTSRPKARLRAIEELSKAGVPVNVMVAPIIPGLNDEEVPKILKAVKEAGARSAAYVLLRLPWAVAPLFENWLERFYPLRKEKVLGRIKEMRGGKLYNAQWGERMSGKGPLAESIENMFDVFVKKEGLNQNRSHLSTEHFKRPDEPFSQIKLL